MIDAQPDREASGEQKLVVHYPAVNRRFGPIFAVLLLAVLTVVFGWLPFLALNQLLIMAGFGLIPALEDPTASVGLVAVLLVVLTPGPLLLGYFTVRLAVLSTRRARGDWWLRLSPKGFEVNDRPGTPRRYAWQEIDKFMLVATPAPPEAAVVAPPKTFLDEVGSGGTGHASLRVGFRCTPGHRRTLTNRLWGVMSGPPRDRDGAKADGLVMGYWDRPFDEAVELMNEWLTRHGAA